MHHLSDFLLAACCPFATQRLLLSGMLFLLTFGRRHSIPFAQNYHSQIRTVQMQIKLIDSHREIG